MPKAGDEASPKPKRAPRKRVTAGTKTTSARTGSKKAATNTRTTTRKAPPRTSGATPTQSRVSSNHKFMLAALLAFLLIGTVSYFIGTSDAGQINVSSTIAQRVSDDTASGGSEETAALQALNQNQNRPSAPNGGLVGRGNRDTQEQKKAPKPVAESTTASSTATTTAETSEAESDATAVDVESAADASSDTGSTTADESIE